MSGLFLVLVLTSWTITSCYEIQEVEAWAGENVTLDCVAVSGDISQTTDNMHPHFRGRVTLKDPKTASIVLENVSVSDSGTYECEVSRKGAPAGDPLNRLVMLKVKDIQEMKAWAGENVTLDCDGVSGDISLLDSTREDITPYSVFFFKNNKIKETYMDQCFRSRVRQKHPQTSNTSIVLQNVSVSDTATYKCRVSRKGAPNGDPLNRLVKLKVIDDVQEVMAKAGDDVTLECVAVSGNITELEWTRPDLAQNKYVFFIRNNEVKEKYIDSQFQGRVTLKDPKTSSIVLKNVTVSDSGTYECYVEENRRQKRAAVDQDRPPDRVVKLTVTDDHHGEDGGSRDGGSRDGGSRDGGSSDGGSRDGGSRDGGIRDGGSSDGGSSDGGSRDGGSRFHGGGIAAAVVAVFAVVCFLVVRRRRLIRDGPSSVV